MVKRSFDRGGLPKPAAGHVLLIAKQFAKLCRNRIICQIEREACLMHPYGKNEEHRSEFPFAVGAVIFDRFELIDRLGAGGMGDLFEVHDIYLDKRLALKVLTAYGDATAVMRFQNEARTTSRLSHPNIATVYDFGLSREGKPYLAIELIEGKSLEEYVYKNRCLTMSQFFDIFIDVSAALECAHREGVIHRDLKPGNIMVDMKASGKHAMVLDFGIAKRVDILDSNASKLTITGQVIGTPLFMSPEQASGTSATPASDLYSLGCVMYFCMAGQPPLTGKTVLETSDLQINSIPLPLRKNKNNEELPPPVSEMIAKLLNKDPKQRFESASELKTELIALKKMLESYAKSVNLPVPTGQTDAGRTMLLTACALALLLLVLACRTLVQNLPEPSKSSPRIMGAELPNRDHDTMAQDMIDNKDIRDIATLRSITKTKSGISRPLLLKKGFETLKSRHYEDATGYFNQSLEDKDISTKKNALIGLIECNIARLNFLEAKAAELQYLNLIEKKGPTANPTEQSISTSSSRLEKTKFLLKVGDLYFSYGHWLFAKRKYDEVLATEAETLTRQELSRVNSKLSACKQNLGKNLRK